MTTLPLKRDVDVIINLSPKSLPRNGFNTGLIIGDSGVIQSPARVVGPFADLPEIVDAGFDTTDPEYLAAASYFAQDGNLGASLSGVYIGRWDANSTNPETITEALQACRAADPNWYGVFVCGLTDVEIAEATSTVETLTPSSCHFYNTSTSSLLAGTENNMFDTLKKANYKATIGFYHENAYFAAGVMGLAMGLNTGLVKSAYVIKFKQIVGMLPSDLSTPQVTNIEKYNGNVYVKTARAQVEQGTMCNGNWFDEKINLDKLANDIQLNIYDAIYAVPKEPQTDGGQNDLVAAVNQANDQALKIGFLAKNGKWRKSDILNLKKGDILPSGYLVQYESVDLQSDADRDARKAQPLYDCVALAGGIQSAVIQINVSR